MKKHLRFFVEYLRNVNDRPTPRHKYLIRDLLGGFEYCYTNKRDAMAICKRKNLNDAGVYNLLGLCVTAEIKKQTPTFGKENPFRLLKNGAEIAVFKRNIDLDRYLMTELFNEPIGQHTVEIFGTGETFSV